MSYLDKEGLDYLWQKIKTALAEKQNTLTGQPGQVVGFDASGAAVPVTRWSNQNLLRNWYFVGGGSQQGGGKFPINHRGQTEYPGGGYTIDGWRADGNIRSVVLDANGLSFSAKPNKNGHLVQKVETYIESFLWGRVITISALINGELYTASGTIPSSRPSSSSNYAVIYLPNGTEIYYRIYDNESANPIIGIYGSNGISGLQALKFELGSVQTLAHQDAEGNWVVNESPDYDLEMLKCQRYLRPIALAYLSNSYRDSLRLIGGSVNLDPPMRAAPTALNPEVIGYALSYGVGSWKFDQVDTDTGGTPETFFATLTLPEGVTASTVRIISKRTDGQSGLGPILLSAEL